jgi:hypothetical protein
MKTAEGGCCSNCSLLDEDGSELLRVSYDRRGYMHLAWGERFSAAPSLITTTDGGLGLNFKMNGLLYNLSRRPDGAMNFDLFGLSDGERRAFRITAAGEVVPISLDVAR